MNEANKLKEVIFKICPLSEQEWEEFISCFTYQKFEKGEHLCREGQIENNVYFIISGISRVYFRQGSKEYTIDFLFENDFISSYLSFLTREPSSLNVEAIESLETLKTSYQQLNALYAKSHSIERLGRLFSDQIYIKKTRREIELLSLTAEQRYKNLLHKNPVLVRNISIKHLSSYLGIHPESLSRIRGKIIE
jgi:CRP/FNR family transcriptional regulator, anaerobic regulatory protein